ncbi:MAG TPA: NAD(P)H-dependent glycerol-3-phosphate dehydrogenase [Acidimicrobiia bacterium]|jgi:glycerol-3-phosphate dehydrogenase (NAD(P)+)|nr:NAD(P)H-dependent glycerol-3-phosphate dehydrogenase [Acidimicrobiia bacterium]
MDRIAVIGAGSWGTTVASIAAAKTDTILWARRPALADAINRQRMNPDYIPGHELPESLTATSDLAEAVTGSEAVIMAVPSHGFREVFSTLAPRLGSAVPVVSLTKGIEQGSLERMTEIIDKVTEGHDPSLTGVLTGPNLAAEILAGQPTASVIAMPDQSAAERLQSLFMGPTFRVYTNDDVVGCELAGALKNVMAIASGMSDGLGFGDNTRATLLTRALAELTRLGVALGGRPETFAGLAGMGDLVATCSSDKSRNHRVGFALAIGKTLDEVVDEMKTVAEGVKTTKSVLGLAARVGVDMPIATHVGMVLDGEMTPREGVLSLMTRQAKAETR